MAVRPNDVKVTVYESSLTAMARGPEMYDFVYGVVSDAAAAMRDEAPVRTGAGRGSIIGRVEMGTEGWYGRASWDRAHYYMGIQNARRSFVEPALTRVRYV
jgi:hypothetical protein